MTCVNCGSDDDVTVREDDFEVSDPLCADCWYEVDTGHQRIYCDIQFAFYNKKEQ